MARPVFGVDRIEEPWAPTWEDGTLLSREELQEIEDMEALGRAYEEAMGGPFCGGIVEGHRGAVVGARRIAVEVDADGRIPPIGPAERTRLNERGL